jgi:hypothetical protein
LNNFFVEVLIIEDAKMKQKINALEVILIEKSNLVRGLIRDYLKKIEGSRVAKSKF